ncbi:hypothetical protein AB0J81_13735 [Streptomyces bobili]|uniref:hypothetical protein n=1 Tax=Streptomyces bobili TaxID=67280 RepID=UPI00342BD21F
MAITASGKGDDDILAALNALAAGSGGKTAASGKVYMGEGKLVRPKGSSNQSWKNIQEMSKGTDYSKWATEEEAASEYYRWDQKHQSDFVAKGILSGMLKLGDGPLEGAALWKKLVKEAAQYGAVGAKVSPIDLMASYVQAAGGTGKNAWVNAGVWQINTQTGERKYTGPGTYLGKGRAQQVDTRVDLTDPDTARAISTKLFQDLMGRDPAEGELAAFANALHSAEQAAPVVATTTTQYDMDTGQALSSDTTQSGGVSGEGKAYIQEQAIKGSKEYGVTQAVTTYQNAFENLIYGSPA